MKEELDSYSKVRELASEPFKMKGYFNNKIILEARTMFQIRAGVLDIKSNRPYQYDDQKCRVCGIEDETLDHIVNSCTSADEDVISTNNVYSITDEHRTVLLSRVERFKKMLQQKD